MSDRGSRLQEIREKHAQEAWDASCSDERVLLAEVASAQAEAAALRFVVQGFVGAVEDLLRHVETRGKGGQQVPFHGDFAAAPPSVVQQLRWWRKRMVDALAEDAGRALLAEVDVKP